MSALSELFSALRKGTASHLAYSIPNVPLLTRNKPYIVATTHRRKAVGHKHTQTVV